MIKYFLFLLLVVLFSACLREEAPPIAARFSVELQGESHTTPLTLTIKNESYGAEFYEWTFEGGEPASSTARNPGRVVFTTPGEHRILLKVRSSFEERIAEQSLRVDSTVHIDFDCEVLVDDTPPTNVRIVNRTRGASSFVWTFDGGIPQSSSETQPGSVYYPVGGVRQITLVASNGSENFTLTKPITLKPTLVADFSYTPIAVDEDWEAPLTLMVKNLTAGGVTHHWACQGADVAAPEGEEGTSIRFLNPGTYSIELTASNGKVERTASKPVTIRANSGIISCEALHLGIKGAMNTIGCFFSGAHRRVFTSQDIAAQQCGASIDFGFFGLNSTFEYCHFFSPAKASDNAFPRIEGAVEATFVNRPELVGITMTAEDFAAIAKPEDFNAYTTWEQTGDRYFTHRDQPHAVLFRTADGRRGAILVREFVRQSSQSYIVADVKVEKRPGE